MRLTPEQRKAIVETFLATFGKGRILLFGSRVNDDVPMKPQPINLSSETTRLWLAFCSRV